MEEVLVPIAVCGMLFVALPWMIFHYVTAWKKNGGLTMEDERLLDDLHEMARRLDDRLGTLERILNAEDPTFRPRKTVDRAAADRHADREQDVDWRRD